MESNEEQNVTLMLIYFSKYELTIASRKNIQQKRKERKRLLKKTSVYNGDCKNECEKE